MPVPIDSLEQAAVDLQVGYNLSYVAAVATDCKFPSDEPFAAAYHVACLLAFAPMVQLALAEPYLEQLSDLADLTEAYVAHLMKYREVAVTRTEYSALNLRLTLNTRGFDAVSVDTEHILQLFLCSDSLQWLE